MINRALLVFLFCIFSLHIGSIFAENGITANETSKNLPPENPNSTTISPTTNTTPPPTNTTIPPPTNSTTPKSSTSSSTSTTTSESPTTIPSTTTAAPKTTTPAEPSTTTATDTTKNPPTTTLVPQTSSINPTAGPGPTVTPSKDRRFDGPSFIGGIVLSLGIMAIAFVSWKFYKARFERNYHTL